VDIAEYRRLTRPTVDLTGLLLGEPALSDGAAEVLAEVEADRKADIRRPIDLEVAGEIEQGILRVRSRGNNEQAAGLERWLRDAELGFADRILPITLPVATSC
jgi:hypothetical protein